ncbi:hypothetical protein VTK56DRAFT_9717 [Thermocarpiscus australiensis]
MLSYRSLPDWSREIAEPGKFGLASRNWQSKIGGPAFSPASGRLAAQLSQDRAAKVAREGAEVSTDRWSLVSMASESQRSSNDSVQVFCCKLQCQFFFSWDAAVCKWTMPGQPGSLESNRGGGAGHCTVRTGGKALASRCPPCQLEFQSAEGKVGRSFQ